MARQPPRAGCKPPDSCRSPGLLALVATQTTDPLRLTSRATYVPCPVRARSLAEAPPLQMRSDRRTRHASESCSVVGKARLEPNLCCLVGLVVPFRRAQRTRKSLKIDRRSRKPLPQASVRQGETGKTVKTGNKWKWYGECRCVGKCQRVNPSRHSSPPRAAMAARNRPTSSGARQVDKFWPA
ncbi:hypothetical protein ANO11243_090180 [Dothideomycetidae sp. 11243]|nr:hypothetical protein ANO11243_090180 [fungal sp. No.11243]